LNLAASIWFKPAKPNGASNCVVHPVSGIDHTLAQVDGPAGFRSVPDPRYWDWLAGGSPATGTYIPLVLTANGETVAWVVGRLYRSRGLLHGTILDLRLKRPDEELAKSAIQYMARALAGFGADDVRAVTTSGLFSAAYKRAGFLAGHRKIPVFAWAGRHQLVTDHISLSCAADDAFCPLQDSTNYNNNQIDTPKKCAAGRYASPLYQKSGGAEPLRRR
jgi:hypothetical protein